MTPTGTKKSRAPFYILTALFWFSIYAYQSNFSPYLKFIGSSDFMAGLIIGSYGLVQFICRVPFGTLGQRHGVHKRFIIGGTLCLTASAVIFFTCSAPPLMLLARVLAGVAASVWVNMTVLFASYHDAGEAVKSVGMLNLANSAGQICAMLSGAWLVGTVREKSGEGAGYHSAFILSLAAAALCFLLALTVKEKRSEPSPDAPGGALRGVWETFKDRRLLSVAFIAVAAQFLIFATVFGFLPQYATEKFSTTAFQNGILTVIPSAVAAIGTLLLAQRLAGKISGNILVFAGMAVMAAFNIVTPFVPAGALWALIAVQALAGAGRGVAFPLLMGLAIAHVDGPRRGTAMGIFQSVYAIGIFAGPVFVGFMRDSLGLSFKEAFIACGALCLVSAVFGLFLLREKK